MSLMSHLPSRDSASSPPRPRRTDFAFGTPRLNPRLSRRGDQGSQLVRNAEQYYHAMFAGRTDSWNLRDTPNDVDTRCAARARGTDHRTCACRP